MDNEKHMDNEIWKVYKIAYTNQYKTILRIWEVSNLGRVKCNGKIVEPYMHGGYLQISTFGIHRAVAELFIPNPDNKPQIDHIDGNTKNNKVSNLRWVTPKENSNNPVRKKRLSASLKGKIRSEEHKKNLSKSLKGRTAWNKGIHGKYHHTEEELYKMSQSHKGKHWKVVDGKRVYY